MTPPGLLRGSLRARLVVACVVVQLAATALLVLDGTRLLQQKLATQAMSEAKQVMELLEQAIAPPLAQRDYATVQQTLDLVRSDDAIAYVVLSDHRGRVVASAGWDESRPLPPRDTGGIDLDRADTRLHLGMPVSLAGQPLGRFDVGLSTVRLREARAEHLRRSVLVGLLALLASALVLMAIALAVTRHLSRLAQASQRVARGDFDVQVPVDTADEIGRLGESFNAMAIALKERVAALQEGEVRQRQLLDATRDEQARLATLLGAMRAGILFVDEDARVLYANAAFARTWGLPGVDAADRLDGIVPLLAAQVEPHDVPRIEAMLLGVAGAKAGTGELRLRDGRVIVQRMQPVARGSGDGGAGTGGSLWFHDDVTLERHTQQRAHQAIHDPLTSLANRRGLYEALHAAVAEAARRGTEVSLLFIDLDDFKQANDAGGHRFGDEILVAVAHTLAAQMRSGELVARLGGDEFAVLCPGASAPEAAAVAARIVEAVSVLRFTASGPPLRIGCSVGVATYPSDARTEDDLVACADGAMYEAKWGGKNGWAAWRDDPRRVQAESARVNWNATIGRALQDGRLMLHFQPVHRASDERLAYHEALVRMVAEDDPRVLVQPGAFIPHAERSGKIRQIDRWVFEACVARLAAAPADVCIAANLSARSLEDTGFPRFLEALLERSQVHPSRLHIELTETAAVADPEVACQMIAGLRNLGCAVHLDDFGSGFSSFAQLRRLEVDAIKIDGVFIRTLQSDAGNRLFVASMIEIAHSLGKQVVAEHVEDAGTLEALRGLGIDLVQGFHLGRPVPDLRDARPRARLQLVQDGTGPAGRSG